MKVEQWCGHEIRFVEQNGEWWAILKDICQALDLKAKKVSERLDPDTMIRVTIDTSEAPLKGSRSRGENKTRSMLAVNELGIYETLFASRRLEAQKFRRWSFEVMRKLRKKVGLEGYQVMRMTDKDIQDEIDHILDTIYWNEEQKCVMQSITVPGGDVEQVRFDV